MSVFRATPNPSPSPRRRNRAAARKIPSATRGAANVVRPLSSAAGGGVFSHAQPKSTPASALPFSTVRSLTAAAKAVNLRDPREVARMAKRRQGDSWQAEAWEYYDAIGEIKYAFTLVASTLSRVRLYAGENSDPSVAPKPANPDEAGGAAAIAALRRLDSAFGGQPGLLRDAALNMCIPGECYLVQIPANSALGIAESWDIRSTDEVEIKTDGSVNLVTRPGGEDGSRRRLPKDAFIARIWRPHPRFSDEADSSMRGLLDACAELMLINKTFRATARSRLNAGLLYLPDGLSVAAQADGEVVPDDDDAEQFIDPTLSAGESEQDDDDFEEALIDAMTTPIADEESAAAVVPLLVRGPAELGEKLRLIQFERSFDPQLSTRADRVLERIMQGLDVPKDIVSGLSNVKYANAIQIDESLMKSHIEPLALLVCDALTVVYLRPALRAAGLSQEDADKYVVWYDASEVTTRPNKAEDSTDGYTRSILSAETWRREHGFGPEDAPTPEEIALRMLVDKGPVTPELAEALLTIVAPEVMKKVREANQAASPAPLPPEVAEALGGTPSASAPDETPPNAESAQPPSTPTPPGATPGAPRDNTVPGLNKPGGPPLPAINVEDIV